MKDSLWMSAWPLAGAMQHECDHLDGVLISDEDFITLQTDSSKKNHKAP